MKEFQVQFKEGFNVIGQNKKGQAAVMVLSAGDSTGGPDNKHKDSDQWLYVQNGEGEAIVAGEKYPLKAGSLLLIEAGETHEIRNIGDKPLDTLNFYIPPEY